MTDKKTISKISEYVFDEHTNIFFPESRRNDFIYSDGDTAEERLLDVIASSDDVSIGSPELINHIHDFQTKYHLSPQRVDLLRPLEHLLKGEILEIGSGCGAITRYLGELGATVTSIEGSARRAEITASRCRDLKNVTVYCENFNYFKNSKKYDVVTLIGVLEYSSLFIEGTFPPQKMLELIRPMLKPGGVVIIAIENQLGLKYFAGAEEDHLGIPFVGIENKYAKKGPRTFGHRELQQLIHESGFANAEFLYPFPDYKFPTAIVTESGAKNQVLNIPDLLKFKTDDFQYRNTNRSFELEHTFPLLIKNGLMQDLANSFLVVAGNDPQPKVNSRNLAYTFSNQRKREFCKINNFIIENNAYKVLKNKTFANRFAKPGLVKQKLENENYISGVLLVNELQELIKTKGWTVQQIADWASPWVKFLKSVSATSDENNIPLLEGKYFDKAPFNIIIEKNKKSISDFDLEWTIEKDLRIDYIVFRGLYYSLAPVQRLSDSLHKRYQKVSEICMDILNLIFPELPLNLELYESSEREIVSEIFDHVPKQFFAQEFIPLEKKHGCTQIFPLTSAEIKIYWSKIDLVFSEEKSLTQDIILTNEPATLSFSIPNDQIHFLQLVVGNEIGLLNIHGINIKNQNQELLWIWDKYNTHHKKNLFLIENDDFWKEKTIVLSASNEPTFIFPIDHLQNKIDDPFIFEITVSSIDPIQSEKLDQITSPLSFINHKQLDEIKNEQAQFAGYNDHLKADISGVKKALDDFILLQAQNIKTSDAFMQQLATNTASFENSRLELSKELDMKNQLIHEAKEEKIKWENELTEKSALLAQTISKLEEVKHDKMQADQIIALKQSELHTAAKNAEVIEQKLQQSLNDTNAHIKAKAILENNLGIKEQELLQEKKRAEELELRLADVNNKYESRVKDLLLQENKIGSVEQEIKKEKEKLKELESTLMDTMNKLELETQSKISLEKKIVALENKSLIAAIRDQIKKTKK